MNTDRRDRDRNYSNNENYRHGNHEFKPTSYNQNYNDNNRQYNKNTNTASSQIRSNQSYNDNTTSNINQNDLENDEKVLSWRRNAIQRTKASVGYERYSIAVKKIDRNIDLKHTKHPLTPPLRAKISKRRWAGLHRRWASLLHGWDTGQGYDTVDEMESFKLDTIIAKTEAQLAELESATTTGGDDAHAGTATTTTAATSAATEGTDGTTHDDQDDDAQDEAMAFLDTL